MWDCAQCGCRAIAGGLTFCPMCFKERDMPRVTVEGGGTNEWVKDEPDYVEPVEPVVVPEPEPVVEPVVVQPEPVVEPVPVAPEPPAPEPVQEPTPAPVAPEPKPAPGPEPAPVVED